MDGYQISFQFQIGLVRDRLVVDSASLNLKARPCLYQTFLTIKFTRAIYTRRVKIYYGIWCLKKELSMYMVNLKFFLEIKLFFCQDRKLKFSAVIKGCPNWLKFCEVSRNSYLKKCWKYHLSMLTNKKVLFLKNFHCTMYHG